MNPKENPKRTPFRNQTLNNFDICHRWRGGVCQRKVFEGGSQGKFLFLTTQKLFFVVPKKSEKFIRLIIL